MHKIRKSLIEQRDESPLSGKIHMDGAYVNGYILQRIKKLIELIGAWLKISVLKQKNTIENLMAGANKTISFVLKDENQKDIGKLANAFIRRRSVVCADENNSYDALHVKFDTRPITPLSTIATMKSPIT